MKKALSLAASEKIYFESADFVGRLAGRAVHGFFGRNGGVSKDVYASLNCGLGSDDEPEAVMQNLALVAGEIGSDPSALLNLYQVHGDGCVTVDAPWMAKDRPKADCFVTDKCGIALGVLTADCAPVLFYGEKADGAPVIGAAHAGWRGAIGGVLASTVDGMTSLGVRADGIMACIGPCIGAASYEVDDGFAQTFLDEDDENERFFMSGQKAGHVMFDLSGYCAFKLFKAGVKQVFIKDLDTYFNEEDFFSFRRATHREEEGYGRQISVIMINEG
jgi:YfiH family protein